MRNAELGRFASECRVERGECSIQVSSFKLQVSVFLFLLLPPLLLRAAIDPSLYPDGRKKVEVRPAESIPFAQQIVQEAPAIAPQEGATEEARLRRILKAMKIGGVSKGLGDKQVLLGSLILKPGKTLPPLLNNQIEVLRVLSVNDNTVVLEFVEKDPAVAARQLFLPFEIKAEVRQFMYGDAVEEVAKAGVAPQPNLPQAANPPDPVIRSILANSQEAEQIRNSDKLMGVDPNAEDKKKTE